MAPGLKLKIGGGSGAGANGQSPTPAVATPSGGSGFKLKLSSQAPSPAATASSAVPTATQDNTEGNKKKRNYARKDKKRPADDDSISPAPKRHETNPARKPSLLLKLPHKAAQTTAPIPAKSRISLKQRQPAPVPKAQIKGLRVKGRAPERAPGNAYDSEDSERERDPQIEQHLVLRMQPGEDCEYLRDAITLGKIGLPLLEGGADVTIKFIDRDYRRAIITIKGRMYAAAVVDLPNIVETMKSWDRKGWYKVADLSQMLLVLGRCRDDHEAKSMPLPPRTVDPQTMQYAHGLTPPMHWVRKRRFRKRLSYKDTANIEEEVAKLLADDDAAVADGGSTSFEMMSRESLERSTEPDGGYYDDDEDADGEAMSTIENGYAESGQEYEQYEEEEEMDVDAVAAGLEDLFDADEDAPPPSAIIDTPTTMVDTKLPLAILTSPNGKSTPTADQTPAETPTETPAAEEEEASSDSDDYTSSEDEEIIDEDAQRKAVERIQQMEEIKDLEREVELQKAKVAGQANQLLRQKMGRQLASLEEDLRIKRSGLGIGEEEDG